VALSEARLANTFRCYQFDHEVKKSDLTLTFLSNKFCCLGFSVSGDRPDHTPYRCTCLMCNGVHPTNVLAKGPSNAVIQHWGVSIPPPKHIPFTTVGELPLNPSHLAPPTYTFSATLPFPSKVPPSYLFMLLVIYYSIGDAHDSQGASIFFQNVN